ncbi:unnamed protein product, partial [Meganyctiphanes norvegica]
MRPYMKFLRRFKGLFKGLSKNSKPRSPKLRRYDRTSRTILFISSVRTGFVPIAEISLLYAPSVVTLKLVSAADTFSFSNGYSEDDSEGDSPHYSAVRLHFVSSKRRTQDFFT